MINFKYFFGAVFSIPLLPLLYFQGKKIKATVPRLPEAQGTEGLASMTAVRTIRMITIGESTIAGVGVETHELGFTGTLANQLATKLKVSVNWKVYAKSGYTAKKVTERLIPTITDTNLDLIVIGLGGNDAFALNSPSQWGKNIEELIVALKKKFPDVPIAFTNMPPIKEFPAFTSTMKFVLGNLVELLGEKLERVIAKQTNVYYQSQNITLKDWIIRMNINSTEKDFFSDGVHPSQLTYQTWAKDFSGFIVENKMIESE
ncbi:MAG: SGNH/GDSL hydrolase family protein [Cyclobacteriaceae bacterium]